MQQLGFDDIQGSGEDTRSSNSNTVRRLAERSDDSIGSQDNKLLSRLMANDPAGCTLFWDDEDAYLTWVHANQDGYVVNCDKACVMSMYPMIHRAIHKSMWTPKRKNYTTGDYFKVCSRSASDLGVWAANRKMTMTRCLVGKCR